MISSIEITGYRSIKAIHFPMRRLSVLAGANGVGKTNLYRALHLLHAAATGTLAEEIAREGGLGSVIWSGERRSHESAKLTLKARLEHDALGEIEYCIEIGFPPADDDKPLAAAFAMEAQIKKETLIAKVGQRSVTMVDRKDSCVWVRDNQGRRMLVNDDLLASETALATLRGGYSEIDSIRHALASWRFYHGFRADADSPLRRPALSVTSPLLSQDGRNLAAVFATLRHIREDTTDLDAIISDAFPGAKLNVPRPLEHATLSMTFPDLPKRAFDARELSDGTLHFLALMGALLSYRLPPFIALNEPETSLHPDLLPALARLIGKAAQRTQIWVVTHSQLLAESLAQETGVLPRTVIRKDGGTWLEGLSLIGTFADE